MTKQQYFTPEIEIAKFNVTDIVTASGTGGGFYGDWDVDLPEIDF